MKLYEFDQAIMDCIDAETGEIVDEEKMNALQMGRDAKIENIALWIKDLKSDAKAISDEKKALAEREQHLKNKAESLESYLKYILNGEKFTTPKVAISFRRSERVIVDDLSGVDEIYLKYGEPTVKKDLVKKILKDGHLVNGCHLEENKSMILK